VRPESKSRVITIDQIRGLMQIVQLKPHQAKWKVGVVVAADRLNQQAANAFLKTLEEPPGQSILILLSTAPAQVLETLLSRCLRLRFAGEATGISDPAFLAWLGEFSKLATSTDKTLLSRYRMLSLLVSRLGEIKAAVQETLAQRSPLEKFDEIDPRQREKWEEELEAAIEAEYRRQRSELLVGLQWWLRDVWLETLHLGKVATFPAATASTALVARRVESHQGLKNLEVIDQILRWLAGNVQEALALEVGLLKLAI